MFRDSRRTEKPTGKRLQKARSEGNVPRTKELPGAFVLGGFLLFAHLFGARWLATLEGVFVRYLSNVSAPEFGPAEIAALAQGFGGAMASLLVAPVGLMMAGAVTGHLIQGPPPLSLALLRPRLSKLNPVAGLGRLLKARGWIEMFKSALKAVLYTLIAVGAVREAMLAGFPGAPGAEGAFATLALIAGKVMWRVLLLALALSIVDWLYTRYEHTRNLMMTRQEVIDERKESEGDPLVKAKLRSKQMALARSRMMSEVSKATVVITNPTHYAVALRYSPERMDVPRVVAKGRGKIAERIREIAIEHGVPIISDPPLARALYRAVRIGAHIPEKLFRAVAEVLALVLRGDRRATGPRPRPPVEEV